MNAVIKISEAAILALHAVDFLAKTDGKPRSARVIAARLGVSYDHLVKVLQRLTRAGLLVPGRGPKGGFLLSKKAETGKLRDVFEAIDGKLSFSDCLLKTKACGSRGCLLGNLLPDTAGRFRKAMEKDIIEK